MAGKTFICSYTINLIREAGEEFDTSEIGKFLSRERLSWDYLSFSAIIAASVASF